jgi:cellulose synthase/poly-beta-1,6-N-acetylglucosamine synthase-like glycosyltransferase
MSLSVITYTCLVSVLAVLAVYRLLQAWDGYRYVAPTEVQPEVWPSVLVQVPLYNERYVAARVINAVCAMDYPRDKLTVQVLDDSTDTTSRVVSEVVASCGARGVNIEHIQRSDRTDFKAGALREGLAQSTSEFVAMFDADFIPPKNFLRRLMSHFSHSNTGMVQARWEHLNANESLLTAAQGILLDGHFINEHGGRAARRHYFNFNGTAGVWRRSCIDDAGGWSGETLTEDLELSYRAQLKGWQFVYVPEITAPAELPMNVRAFKTQQYRWAKGSIETARLLLVRLWRTPQLDLSGRVEATVHLCGNLAYPLVLVVALLLPLIVDARIQATTWSAWILDGMLLLGSTGALMAFYWLAEHRLGRGWTSIVKLPIVLAVGVGLAINNTLAVFDALRGKRTPFERTPKVGAAGPKALRSSYALRANGTPLVELALGAYIGFAMISALIARWYLAVPFLALFASGFLYLGILGLWPQSGDSVAAKRATTRAENQVSV